MRKAILSACTLGLAISSHVAQAYNTDDSVNTLSINITNATSSLCTLTGSALQKGAFFLNDYIPEFIPPYSSSAPIVLNSCLGADLVLSYACGNDKNITFNSQEIMYFFSIDVTANVLSSNNMNATYRINKESYHTSINWRFEE